MSKVTIICDGSSRAMPNGARRAAAAAILIYNDSTSDSPRFKILVEPLNDSTNNQAEIIAPCIGLEALENSSNVEVLSDSQYLIETMKGNFQKKANHQWWCRLEEAATKHHVQWRWIRGHDENELQKIADYLARKTAEFQRAEPTVIQLAEQRISRLLNEEKK